MYIDIAIDQWTTCTTNGMQEITYACREQETPLTFMHTYIDMSTKLIVAKFRKDQTCLQNTDAAGLLSW